MHWKHSRFEVAYVILGNCHTYDEAYRILSELEEDRDFAIESSLAESLRAQAKVITAKVIQDDPEESKSGKLLAQCNIDEQRARKVIAQPCLDEARRELAFIQMLKDLVESRRRYRHLPDHVAHQLAQQAEWKFDLHWKSYNYLCSTGHVPHDHMMLLRMHPESGTLLNGLNILINRLSMHGQDESTNFLMMQKQDVLAMVAKDEEYNTLLHTSLFDEQKVLEYTPDDSAFRIAHDRTHWDIDHGV